MIRIMLNKLILEQLCFQFLSNLQYVFVFLSILRLVKESIIAPEKIVFEDCYTGVRAFQVLSLRNITEQPVDVHFESDSSSEVAYAFM